MLSKWIVIPRIVTGKQLDPGSKAIQDPDWLIKLRNELVHDKPRKKVISRLDDYFSLHWEYQTEKAIETVRSVVSGLKEIDGEAWVGWEK